MQSTFLQEIINHIRGSSHSAAYASFMSPPVVMQILLSMKIIMGEDGTDQGWYSYIPVDILRTIHSSFLKLSFLQVSDGREKLIRMTEFSGFQSRLFHDRWSSRTKLGSHRDGDAVPCAIFAIISCSIFCYDFDTFLGCILHLRYENTVLLLQNYSKGLTIRLESKLVCFNFFRKEEACRFGTELQVCGRIKFY